MRKFTGQFTGRVPLLKGSWAAFFRHPGRTGFGLACVTAIAVGASFMATVPANAAVDTTNAAVDTTVVNVASDTCLDNYHDQLANYNEVYGWECNETNAQTWTFYKVGGSSQSPIFEIELTDTGFCLDNYHSIAKSGNPVDIYECDGSAAQLWQGRGESLISGNGGGAYCLDLYHGNSANMTRVQIYACNGTDAQLWYYGY